MPDITILPDLARVLETTIDYILCSDEKAVEDVLTEKRKTNPFYGSRSYDNILFRDELAEIEKKYKKIILQCIESKKLYIAQNLDIKSINLETILK